MTQYPNAPKTSGPELDLTELSVSGMTCQHCQKAVTQALEGVPGVREVSVDLSSGLARVRGEAEPQALLNAVQEEGYQVALRQ
ncbi:heavy metal transport/detoxification protein [Deinococcus irradiatisoli]|uniref:Heavy metal transport/detoxification protein n=1 Tax=Deinococcus irradiatisoli TaxID=2202254 RepID=A0A2Z3JFG9_9DEIO|nr:heavy-metal-associated domain-containing protein [Deinococcus irradiatisoli]AWN23782.1 heavy metal transport/detoxification protein [Deinococcus irradiatisoli]